MSVQKTMLLVLFLIVPSAETLAEKQKAVGDSWLNPFEILKQHGLHAGGWLAIGGTYSMENPGRHNNSPITFNDQTNVVQLNQADLYLERLVDMESGNWNVGGRVDTLFGTDSRFTQSRGLDAGLLSHYGLGDYDLAIPQAYLEVSAPFGSGVTARIGHFYTIIGHEVVTAPNNFFYSHSYAMQYGEPFTHTGVLLSYALNNNFTVNGGAVNGWDNFDHEIANWSFLGDVSWTNDEVTSTVSWSVISGDAGNSTPANRTLSSLVISQRFSDKWRYVFQHDFGFQERPAGLKSNVYWYGVNQYLFYDLSDKLSAGIRGEWFRDNNGVRLNMGSPGNYWEVSAGLNWKVLDWISLRPELRYDWSDSMIKVYDNHSRNRQLEIAMDLILAF